MQVSLKSAVYLGTCVAINAYAAYSSPTRWVTAFAIGILTGTFLGHYGVRDAQKGYQPENSQRWDADKDKRVREKAVKFLADSMPRPLTTAINVLALGLISQRVQLPSGWNPLIGTLICAYATFEFGLHVGMLFQLDVLRRDQDPKIQELLADTVI